MRKTTAWLLLSLPFGDRSRRAIEETLLDWAHEEATATTHVGRAWVTARALVGVARSVAGAVALDVAHVPYGWLLRRLILVGLPPGALLAGKPLFDNAANMAGRGVDAVTISALLALLVPQALSVVLPLALFWAVLFPPREERVPAIGVAVLGFMAVLTLTGWVAPYANQEFRERTFAFLTRHNPVPAGVMLQRGLAEQTSAALVQLALTEGDARARRQLVARIGLVSVTPALVLLGIAASKLTRRVRRHLTWIVPVGAGISLAIVDEAGFLVVAAVCLMGAHYLARSMDRRLRSLT